MIARRKWRVADERTLWPPQQHRYATRTGLLYIFDTKGMVMMRFVAAFVCSCALAGTAAAQDAMSKDAMKKDDQATNHAMKKEGEGKNAMHGGSMMKGAMKNDSMRASGKIVPAENARRKDSMKKESDSDAMRKDGANK